MEKVQEGWRAGPRYLTCPRVAIMAYERKKTNRDDVRIDTGGARADTVQ